MLPSFGEVFGEPLPAYFVLLMSGFALAVWLAARWAKRLSLDHEAVIDLALVCLVAGVAGARVLHVLADGHFWDYVHLCTDPGQVVWRTVTTQAECAQLEGLWRADAGTCHPPGRDCLAWAKFYNGGLAYYGGLLGAIGAGFWFVRREGLPAWRCADAAAMFTTLGLYFGRLGCFFGGCCFGVVTASPLGLSFPPGSAASRKQEQLELLAHKGLPSLPVHPTQLYEALGCLWIAMFTFWWVHPRKRFDGEVFCVAFGLYALLRFGLEYLRADDRGGVLGLSTSQWLGLVLLAAVAWLWRVLGQESEQTRLEPHGRASA